jgi:hypothetical protein
MIRRLVGVTTRSNQLIPERVGRAIKMPNNNKTAEPKAVKKYAKTRGEHYKDIVITILVTAIIAFICGAVFQSKQQNAINTAVKAVTPSASAEASK